MATTVLTLELPDETQVRLDQLAQRTRRDTARLAEEAIAGFVDRELATIDGIERARADVEAGRGVPDEAAMDRIRSTIAGAAKGA